MLRMNRVFCVLVGLALLVAACQPITRLAAPEPQPPQGLRPDAPSYAVHGPFAVGARDFVIGEGEDAFHITVWYPALNLTNAKEEITYQINPKAGSLPPLPPASLIALGQAIQDAAPDRAQGPYPLVIFAPGLAGFRQQNSYLPEHLASYGFVVMAGDPRGETLFGEFWAGATRPLDTKRTIAYADKLTAPGGEWAGLIDTDHIAVAGHSSGGWGALAGGGAQMDFGWCAANPELITEGTDCTQFPAHQEEIAAMLGLAAAPQGLWPPTNDPRVDAVLALAPDGDIWGVDYGGVAGMTVPTLIMTGSGDTINIPERTAYPIYEHVGSAKKSLVVLENADHFIFFQQCRSIPWMADNAPFFVCSDPVWDMDRAHDLINHLATAFLLAELQGDAEAAKALAPENVTFPGIRYETTVATASAPAAVATLDEETVAKLEGVIEQGMKDFQVPGVAIGVVKDGQLIYAKGFGVAELGSDRTVTPQSVFQLSSIAKTATSTAIMQLVEQGKIELDAPVTQFLPYFQLADERYEAITIRHLLSHTAGLPEYDYTAMGEPEYDDDALERYVRSLRDLELLSAPGEKWEYSGIGYDVLGDVVAKVSGQSFETYVAEHILMPLGMRHSTFLLNEVDLALLVSPHIPDEAGKTVVNSKFPYTRIHAPDTTFYSNLEDMARYAIAHLNQGELDGQRVLDVSTYEETWKVHGETWFPPPDSHLERNYGLGWTIGEYQGHRIIGHGGLDVGFNAFLTLLPEEATAVVMLANYSYFNPEDIDNIVLPAFFIREPVLDVLLGAD